MRIRSSASFLIGTTAFISTLSTAGMLIHRTSPTAALNAPSHQIQVASDEGPNPTRPRLASDEGPNPTRPRLASDEGPNPTRPRLASDEGPNPTRPRLASDEGTNPTRPRLALV